MIDKIKQNLSYDLVFLGIAQNCQSYIKHFFTEAKKISKRYKTKLIIGENGSYDDTFYEIHQYLNHNKTLNLDFVDTTFIEKYSNRIVRLSKARQKLMHHLKKENIQSKYVCVIDLDDILERTSVEENINKMILILENNKNQYFAVSAKSHPYYYDILNFESEEHLNIDILKLMNNKSLSTYFKRKNKIYNMQKKITKYLNIASISSFNGMCLYFFNDYIKSNYYNLDEAGEIIPEHLNLNRIIAKNTGKKILVSNDIILNMPKEHKPLFNIIFFIISKLNKYFNHFK